MSEKEEADIAQIYATIVQGLVDSQVIGSEDAVKELIERKIFLTPVEAMEFLESAPDIADPFGGNPPFGQKSEDSGKKAGPSRAQNARVYLLNVGEWDESKHSRGDNGKFGPGGGGKPSAGAGGKTDITELLGKEHTGVKGQAAIDALLKEKGGHVKDAFHREGIGGIDLMWGDNSFGLQHIIKRRTEEGQNPKKLLSELGKVMENGTVFEGKSGGWEIHHGGKIAVIAPELHGNKMSYVLTAFTTGRKN
jgi:hypothetical protein